MSKKKTAYKPKYKGVRYIAKSLVKYQSKKYPNYNKALPDARKYLAEIKSSGQKVKLSSIWNLSRNRRQQSTSKKTKGSAPKIDKNLLELGRILPFKTQPRGRKKELNQVVKLHDEFYLSESTGSDLELLLYEKEYQEAPAVNPRRSSDGPLRSSSTTPGDAEDSFYTMTVVTGILPSLYIHYVIRHV